MTQHIKYPEEVRMEAIERMVRNKPVFFMSPNLVFIGTLNSYYLYDPVNNRHEIVGDKLLRGPQTNVT